MPRPTKVIVAPEGDEWTVREEGQSIVARHPTQELALAAGRVLLEALGGGELETRGRDGTIIEARTLGAKENRRSPG